MELIIFIGLQASGKSTFFRTHFAKTHDLVSKDLMRNNRNKARRQAQLIEASLKEGKSVVLDNTNASVEGRASIIQLGKMYDAQIIGYYFQSVAKHCYDRNQQRTGKAKVSDVAIYATLKKLARPSYREGFDRLFYVRIAENFNFDVREWQENEVKDG
ncbi:MULTISPECIES: AAA family ATPase [Aerosakkonema]|uniref:AAA family ATPase n=1 Tax=Aerosakkonema TaxID=1246629 RepID=UPI0035B9AA79